MSAVPASGEDVYARPRRPLHVALKGIMVMALVAGVISKVRQGHESRLWGPCLILVLAIGIVLNVMRIGAPPRQKGNKDRRNSAS